MIEIQGNIFDFINDPTVDAICITTNGIVNGSGLVMMGAGTAGECARRYPLVRKVLGAQIKEHGNTPHCFGYVDRKTDKYHISIFDDTIPYCALYSFPTKNDFRDKSDIELIRTSAMHIKDITDNLGYKKLIVPAPGIGKNTGQLSWQDVKEKIKDILDDRFYIAFLEGH